MTAPTLEQLEAELQREQNKNDIKRLIKNTVVSLLVITAVVTLTIVLFLPVIRVEGRSMENTLESGNFVLVRKGMACSVGEVVAFHYSDKILVKRVIAVGGDRVEILEDGTVYVNGKALEEAYVKNKDIGICDINFPYDVPDGELFVLGDHRMVSADSRNKAIGSIKEEKLIGKLIFRIWPIRRVGLVK